MKFVDGSARLSASDLSNFLACRHLTRLDGAAARGERRAPAAYDLGFQELIEAGRPTRRASCASSARTASRSSRSIMPTDTTGGLPRRPGTPS